MSPVALISGFSMLAPRGPPDGWAGASGAGCAAVVSPASRGAAWPAAAAAAARRDGEIIVGVGRLGGGPAGAFLGANGFHPAIQPLQGRRETVGASVAGALRWGGQCLSWAEPLLERIDPGSQPGEPAGERVVCGGLLGAGLRCGTQPANSHKRDRASTEVHRFSDGERVAPLAGAPIQTSRRSGGARDRGGRLDPEWGSRSSEGTNSRRTGVHVSGRLPAPRGGVRSERRGLAEGAGRLIMNRPGKRLAGSADKNRWTERNRGPGQCGRRGRHQVRPGRCHRESEQEQAKQAPDFHRL